MNENTNCWRVPMSKQLHYCTKQRTMQESFCGVDADHPTASMSKQLGRTPQNSEAPLLIGRRFLLVRYCISENHNHTREGRGVHRIPKLEPAFDEADLSSEW